MREMRGVRGEMREKKREEKPFILRCDKKAEKKEGKKRAKHSFVCCDTMGEKQKKNKKSRWNPRVFVFPRWIFPHAEKLKI